MFQAGLVKGTAHSYVGQEAVATGACAALSEQDAIVGNHRGHGHCIAKGARIDRMMAELMGRETGYCRGLGGSMHIAALDLNILGCNGIVAAGLPIGTGAALAARLRKSDVVVTIFFGDGGANQGTVHESMNLAAIWNLPVVFLCENNHYALSTSSKRTTAGEGIAARSGAYGFPGVRVDGNDVLEVYQAMRHAVARARSGKGPTLLEAVTYRWGDHSMRANRPGYRTKDEELEWQRRDPLARFEMRLIDEKLVAADRLKQIRNEAEHELEEAVAFGMASAEPTVEVMESSVYAPHIEVSEPARPAAGTREITFVQALNEAMHGEMARDPRVFVMGEDVGLIGGIFGATRGLREAFGEERVRDTPISEPTFVGMGVGAAVSGLRPIVELQIFDFVAMTMDQIVNQAAKFRYMLGGTPTVPLVIRGPQGGGIRLAAQHSQSLEAWFIHVPGLVVVAPSTPADAKGLLTSAIRDDNPVIFLEHKVLYAQKGPVPEASYAIPLGKADVKRAGTDVTVVATQVMVQRALAAAEELAGDGISVEVIDPRSRRSSARRRSIGSTRPSCASAPVTCPCPTTTRWSARPFRPRRTSQPRCAPWSDPATRRPACRRGVSEILRLTRCLELGHPKNSRDPNVGATFLITAREGFEAALLLGLVYASLNRLGRHDQFRNVTIGAWVGFLASVLMGIAVTVLSGPLLDLGCAAKSSSASRPPRRAAVSGRLASSPLPESSARVPRPSSSCGA